VRQNNNNFRVVLLLFFKSPVVIRKPNGNVLDIDSAVQIKTCRELGE